MSGHPRVGLLDAGTGHQASMNERVNDQLPDLDHTRPDGVGDETVDALGKFSEALEAVEAARGFLYSFHRLSGTADLTLGKAVEGLRRAGHHQLADVVDRELLGRNVLFGRWTFQVVEEYDDGYYDLFKSLENRARNELADGRRHLFEAEMKQDRRSEGHAGHEATPRG